MAFKILGLHGSSQTGEIFRTRLEPICSKFSGNAAATWEFPDGPILLEKQENDDVARRVWYDRKCVV